MDQAGVHQGPTPVQFDHLPLQQQGNDQRTRFIDFSHMGWGNGGLNHEHSVIAAGPTEFQHPTQNLYGHLPQYCAGSGHEPGAIQIESLAYSYSPAALDYAHQSNELLPARSHFQNLPNRPQSAICTEPQYRSNRPHTAGLPSGIDSDLLHLLLRSSNVLAAWPTLRSF